MALEPEIRVLSSMATRRLLAELAARYETSSPAIRVSVESVGGVEAARRVRAGEPIDAVVLAADVIDDLIRSGHVVPGSRVDLAVSAVALAVRGGAPHPDISSAEAVKRAVLGARSVGYSTGPSGTHLARLFAGWDDSGALKSRTTVAPPGVPVGTLVARGEVELGFQQISELMDVAGIDVVGLLPSEIQAITTFSGGIAQTSSRGPDARALLEFMAAPELADVKRRHGMDAP